MKTIIKKELFLESGLSVATCTAGYTKIEPEPLMSADARNVCVPYR